jgi:hypothetical protein
MITEGAPAAWHELQVAGTIVLPLAAYEQLDDVM